MKTADLVFWSVVLGLLAGILIGAFLQMDHSVRHDVYCHDVLALTPTAADSLAFIGEHPFCADQLASEEGG